MRFRHVFVVILAVLSWAVLVFSFGEMDIRQGGSLWARIEADGDIRINGSLKGRFESGGWVRKDGSLVGEIEADGTIRRSGSIDRYRWEQLVWW